MYTRISGNFDVSLFTLDPETDSGRLSNACHLNSPPMTRMTTYDKIVTSSLLSQPESLVTVSGPLIGCWLRRDVTTCDIKVYSDESRSTPTNNPRWLPTCCQH